jgi:hypothetical protein
MKGKIMNTFKLWLQKLSTGARCAVVPLVILATSGLAQQQHGSQTFGSTAEAAQSLFQAVQRNDEQAIENILGGPTDLTSTTDGVQDKVERDMFVQKYQEMHRVGREPDGAMTLYIGAENWPFPIPLVQTNGAWRFDADAGRKEVLFRRIGENELAAITMCYGFVANEKSYSKNPSAASLEGISPTSLVARAATDSAGGDPLLIHGYYFRMLPSDRQTASKTARRFTLIAYPAAYRSSGVMTFVVTEKDVVYEKDLGPKTSTIAGAMAAFRKDATWVDAGE